MTCPSCQKDIAAGSKFCYSCGAKQPETASAAPPPAYYQRKRFVRSTNDRKVAGVCAGVADYFDMDPTLVRVLWALATMIPGPNILAYIVIWIAADEGPTGMARTSATAVS
ncbi:MAG TPA: PspC domain-containing protein [Candidatus Acidoferrum sp.]|nr:PspC domain-containing protein [Candidatus Acidoferrum sp.]